jgi:hypothetical protein
MGVSNKQSNPKFDKFSVAEKINCTSSNCNIPNFCITDNTVCKCSSEYAEYELNKPLKEGEKPAVASASKAFCQYQRKKQLTYFLLEFFLNIGAGHLYAGNVLLGILKLLIVILPCLGYCVFMCVSSNKDNGTVKALSSLFGCVASIWWLTDLILIGTRHYDDGNTVPLAPW